MADFNTTIVYEGQTILRIEKGSPMFWGINNQASKKIKNGDSVVMHELILCLIVAAQDILNKNGHSDNNTNEEASIEDVKNSLRTYLKMVDESLLNKWLRILFREVQSHPYLNKYIGPSFMRHSVMDMSSVEDSYGMSEENELINAYVYDVLCLEEMKYLFQEGILKKDEVFNKISLIYVKENMSSLLEQYFFLTKTIPFIEQFDLNHPESIKEWEDYLEYVKENVFDDVMIALKDGNFHSLQRNACEKEFFDVIGINDNKKREKLEIELVNFIKSPSYDVCVSYVTKLWWQIVNARENKTVQGTLFENVIDIVEAQENEYECILNLEKLAKVNDLAKDYFHTLDINEYKAFIEGDALMKFFESENSGIEFNVDFTGGDSISHLKEYIFVLKENNPKYINEKQENIREMLKGEYITRLETVLQHMTFPIERLSKLFEEVGLEPITTRFKYMDFENKNVYSAIIRRENQYEVELLKNCLKQLLYSNQVDVLEKVWKIQIDESLMRKDLEKNNMVLHVKKTHKF